jgi:TPR repeat protein
MTTEMKGERDILMFGGNLPASSKLNLRKESNTIVTIGKCKNCQEEKELPVECTHCSLNILYCSRDCLRKNLISHNKQCRNNYLEQSKLIDRQQRIQFLGTPSIQSSTKAARLSNAVSLLRGDKKRVSGSTEFEAQRARWRVAPGNELLAAVNIGDLAAMYVYAIRLCTGDGVLQDGWQAAEYLKKAGDAGIALAAGALGDLFFKGVGDFPRDLVSSSRWHLYAAEVLNHVQSFYGLGCALEGLYIENGMKDVSLLNKAREAYLKAALEGISSARDAIRRLRRITTLPEPPTELKVALAVNVPSRPRSSIGTTVKTETTREIKILDKMESQSLRFLPKPQYLSLTDSTTTHNDNLALPLNKNNTASTNILTNLTLQLSLYDKYIISPLKDILLAANGEMNCPAAQCVLGHLCLQGNRLVSKNVKKAIDYLEQSSNQNFALAQLTLGMMLAGDGKPKQILSGESQREIDDKLGPRFEKWWMLSGTSSSLYKTNEDGKRGLELVRKAASQGLVEAHFIAGRHAEAGIHTSKNFQLALTHFKIAYTLDKAHVGAKLGVERRTRHLENEEARIKNIRLEKINAILCETENGKKLVETLEQERRVRIEKIYSEINAATPTKK